MEDLRHLSYTYPAVTLDDRKMCDLELIINGSFHPLDGFMTEEDYHSVLKHVKLANGACFPLPICLPVPDNLIEKVKECKRVTIKDKESFPIAVIDATSIWKPNLNEECVHAFGCDDDNHPYVPIVLSYKDCHYVGGKIHVITNPRHYDFTELRRTPAQTKELIKEKGWKTVVGFQTRNPMHRCHYELSLYALKHCGDPDAHLLLQPVVGITQSVDVEYHARVRCYKEIMKYYPEGKATLTLLNLSMRMAGPREALLHAIIRQNHGCTHFVIGRDHAGPSFKKKNGDNFYGPLEAQEFVAKHADQLTIKILTCQALVYVKELDKYLPQNEVPAGMTVLNISGTEQRDLLNKGAQIPEWFTYPEISRELILEYKPLHLRGFAIYLVGLSGSGKTTINHAILARFQETLGHRTFSILDADEIRTNLSKGLGFSKEDRSTNVRRIGYAASLIVRHGGVALIANIAPYKEDRAANRKLISQYGGYFEIYVNTKIEECENRDCKGLYKAAREGKIASFTGVSDPFEEPENPELNIDGSQPVEKSVCEIIDVVRKQGYLG